MGDAIRTLKDHRCSWVNDSGYIVVGDGFSEEEAEAAYRIEAVVKAARAEHWPFAEESEPEYCVCERRDECATLRALTTLDPTEAPEGFMQTEYGDMCPNCVTPWKCNGPHLQPEDELILEER